MDTRLDDFQHFDDVAKSQLQQAYMRLSLDDATTSTIPPLPATWKDALQKALSTSSVVGDLGSRTQTEVSDVLKHLGWVHTYEYFEAKSGLSLDMAKPEIKVAVEFDGPVHYFANRPWMLTGRSKLKRRLLDLVGWDIVYVDYRDWDAARDKAQCLTAAFDKHGVPAVFSTPNGPLPVGPPAHTAPHDAANASSASFAALQRFAASRLDRAAPAYEPNASARPVAAQPAFYLDYGPG